MLNGLLFWVVCMAVVGVKYASGQVHEGDLVVASSQPGGGRLMVVDYQEPRYIPVSPALCSGGTCLLSAVDPGFAGLPHDDAARSAFALRSTVPVYLEIVATGPGASIRVGSSVLKQAGERALLGRGPGLHVHPSWQLTLPEGQEGRASLQFRLATTDRNYSPSEVYRVEIVYEAKTLASPTPTASPSATPSSIPTPTPTNLASPTPSITPTTTLLPSLTPTAIQPSATATTTASASPTQTPATAQCLGDCDGDGEVAIEDIVSIVNIALGNTSLNDCPRADRNGDGLVTIDEIIGAVNLALAGCSCATSPQCVRPVLPPRT